MAINSATGNSITPTEAGNYSVKVSSNGCNSDESDKYNYTITGLVNLNNNHFIKLSSNPVTDNVRLEFEVAGSYDLTIQLIDMYGKICKTFTNQTSGSQLSIAALNSGVYIANIFISNQKKHYNSLLNEKRLSKIRDSLFCFYGVIRSVTVYHHYSSASCIAINNNPIISTLTPG